MKTYRSLTSNQLINLTYYYCGGEKELLPLWFQHCGVRGGKAHTVSSGAVTFDSPNFKMLPEPLF